jgi:hypothetical protein
MSKRSITGSAILMTRSKSPYRMSRRAFVRSAAGLTVAASMGASAPRKKIALIGTVDTAISHMQNFVDRWLFGYSWDGGWRRPEVDLASLFVDQFPERDLARARSKRFGVPIFPTIADALTLGGAKLAVDGVLIIGEHGKYPRNAKGQTLYPRYEFFKEVVKIFESSGRSVPVFNDKHLSTDWKKCVEMVADSKRLGFPFLAGSSLPVTRRFPAVDVPLETPLTESVCAGYGAPDSYDFHGLETAQCMSERRKGGEVGIARVHALRGNKIWDVLGERKTTQRLLLAALSRSNTLPVENGYLIEPVSIEWARKLLSSSLAYFIDHRDGFKTTLFLLPIRDFNYAGSSGRTGEIISCQMNLPMPTQSATTANFFNPLIRHIERMIVENRAPYPVERTLLTSGMTMAAVESLYQGELPVETVEMEVRYTAPRESLFWQT